MQAYMYLPVTCRNDASLYGIPSEVTRVTARTARSLGGLGSSDPRAGGRSMATIDHTFTVNAEPPVVFGYLTDPDQATVWQSSLLEARFEPEGEIRPGTQIHEVRKMLGRRIESTVEVTEFEQHRGFGGGTRSGPIPWHF